MDRAGCLTEHLKEHDRALFAQKHDGVIHVFRKTTRIESCGWNGGTLLYTRDDKAHVLSLTDDWSIRGKPVDWGTEPVMSRLREIDGWNRHLFDEMLEQHQAVDSQKDRRFKSNNEDFLKDFRPQFARAYNEFSVGQLKHDNRRKKDA